MLKPKGTGITTMFREAWYVCLNYPHFTWEVNCNLYIENIPVWQVRDLYNEILETTDQTRPCKVVLSVVWGKSKQDDYFTQIENMILW